VSVTVSGRLIDWSIRNRSAIHQQNGHSHFAMDDATFIGRFPIAEIEFFRDAFPGKVRMTAFSPFIPHNERDSSMPAALFAFTIENDTDAAIDYTIASCTRRTETDLVLALIEA
jgi:uncharacterized protein (DUF608 family)